MAPLTHKGDNDYVLNEGETSVWIEVDGLAVYVRRNEFSDAVIVEVYPVGAEDGAPEDTFTVYQPEKGNDED